MTLFRNILLFCALLATSASSMASLFKDPSASLKAFCEHNAPRQTLIYLDQSVISLNDADWFKDIQNKVKFLPSERISFMMISSDNSRVKDIWTVCHPSMTAKRYNHEKDQRSVFQTSVDKELKEATKAYTRTMNQALAVPLNGNSNSSKPHYNSGEFPKKSLVEAIYFDSSRFDTSDVVTRVVIFSNMVEYSEITTPEMLTDENTAKALARKAAKRYPLDLKNAEFHVYGVGYTHNNADLDRKLKTFWQYWLNRSGAYLKTFDAQLSTAGGAEVFTPYSYTGVMKQNNGTKVATKLRLGFGEDGRLANSWFGIKELRYPLKGELSCKANLCTVNAEIAFGDEENNLFRAGDVIKLTGKDSSFSGTIGAEDDLTRTQDGEKFSLSVAFEKDNKLQF